MKITVVIHTYNEENNIRDCIKSAKLLSNNIIVVDMKSDDNTVRIAKENGVEKVYEFERARYVEPAREFGINKADGEWVFLLDADERITMGLSNEIKEELEKSKNLKLPKNSEITYYKVPRKNIFVGKKWLEHGGWWPDAQIRLIKKDQFITWPKRIHATPKINGNMGVLKNSFEHLFHPNLENMVDKTIIYENIESDLLFKAKRNVSVKIFFRKFFGEMWRRLFKKMGFLDGTYGLIESIYQAFSKTITYLFLYEKKQKSSSL